METALHRAARLGDVAAIERLVAGGADVNARLDLEVDNGPHLRALTLAEQHLQSWTKINRSKKRSDIGSFGTPEEIKQRHKRALQEAEECLNLLRQSARPDASR